MSPTKGLMDKVVQYVLNEASKVESLWEVLLCHGVWQAVIKMLRKQTVPLFVIEQKKLDYIFHFPY